MAPTTQPRRSDLDRMEAPTTRSAPSRSSRLLPNYELRVVGLYAVLGSLWILGSDLALHWLEHESIHSYRLQTFKGLNFILVTALLLYAVLLKSFRRWRRAELKVERSRQQFRALSARLQSLREDERGHIAREIHDELGQMLTGLKMDLRSIERRLGDSSDPALNWLLDKVVETGELTDATIETVQRISAELRPGLLDNLGLCPAIRYEAARFQERTSVICRVECPESPPPLPRDVATAAFRIVQEALTNVTRHAQATEVDLTLRIEIDELRLEVRDNGKGIHAFDLDDPKSLGLLGMRERAWLLGGDVEISPAPSRGTRVAVRLPLKAAAGSPALPLS